jgi:excisionase family DNA binding protein
MTSERQTSDGRTRGGNAFEMKKPPGSVDGTVPGVERRIGRMLDSYEAAAILRIHPKTLQRMARNGEIRGVQVGKVWRFRSSDIEWWIGTKLAS